MAISANLLLALLCTSLTAPALTRVLTPNRKETTLDVAYSIRKTQIALSDSDPTEIQELDPELTASESSGPSLEVKPRQRTSFPDYASLTSARLARDSARVRSVLARLDLETPVISGTSEGSGEYFVQMGVGQPAKRVDLVLDTGSDVTWLQSAPCENCYHQSEPLFQPSNSSTYAPLSCDAYQCRSLDGATCRNRLCQYDVSYGDGSFTSGDFVTETVTLGGAAVRNIAIGCGHYNQGLFIGAGGLLGLGQGAVSFPSQLHARAFSYCLVDRDTNSSSTLEFHTTADPPVLPGTVPANLLHNPQLNTFYFVDLTAVAVGGVNVPVAGPTVADGASGVIVDSGTAVTRLPLGVYDSIRDEFVRGTTHLKAAPGVSLFDTCYDLSSAGDKVSVTTVAFVFSDGESLDLPAANYLIPVDDKGTFCFAFASTPSGISIIGNVQQQGIRVTLDLAGNAVGFSPTSC